jgi:hypothetical protein
MALNNFAYYNTETGLIENVLWIEDDTVSTLVWPTGYAVVDIPDGLEGEWSVCSIGWSYINGQFIEPPQPEPEPLVAAQDQPTSQGAQTL